MYSILDEANRVRLIHSTVRVSVDLTTGEKIISEVWDNTEAKKLFDNLIDLHNKQELNHYTNYLQYMAIVAGVPKELIDEGPSPMPWQTIPPQYRYR